MNTNLVAAATDEPVPVSDLGAERVRSARAALAGGEMVVLSDDADATLVLLGSTATSASIARMIRAGSGLLFTAVSRERLRQLAIPRMAADDDPRASRFHVAVDAAAGIGTGISAADRSLTIRLLSDSTCSSKDFVRPGHVIPVAGDVNPPHAPGTAELALALAGLVGDEVPTAAYCALISHRDPRSVAGPDEGAAFARLNGLAFVHRADVLAAFYRAA